jgi:hypothetical protein
MLTSGTSVCYKKYRVEAFVYRYISYLRDMIAIASHHPVEYDHPTHRYSYKGKRYLSATQLLEHFIPPFDTKERSEYMAYRYGNTPEYWVNKWKAENSLSLTRGTDIHDEQERLTYEKRFIEYNPAPLPVLQYDKYTPYRDLCDGVYPEMLLWSHEHRIAGRTDKGILRTLHKGEAGWVWMQGQGRAIVHADKVTRIADIEDYKTNKRLNKESWQDSRGNYRYLLGPVSHIMDSNYWHYALQLSIYQFMLEQYGFHPGERRIIHFPHEIEGLGTPAPETYRLPYLRKEVIAMIAYVNDPTSPKLFIHE